MPLEVVYSVHPRDAFASLNNHAFSLIFSMLISPLGINFPYLRKYPYETSLTLTSSERVVITLKKFLEK